MSETPITKLKDFSQTSVTTAFQTHSDALQTARATQQGLYDAAQGGPGKARNGAVLAAIEADVAPRANRQYGVHTAPDATAGVTP